MRLLKVMKNALLEKSHALFAIAKQERNLDLVEVIVYFLRHSRNEDLAKGIHVAQPSTKCIDSLDFFHKII